MIHFAVGVIIPKEKRQSAGDVQNYLANVLARYSENTEVDPYEGPCECGRWNATKLVREALDKEFGDMESVSHWFTLMHQELADDEKDKLWKKDIAEPRKAFAKKLTEENPEWLKPRSDCEKCHGTGTRTTTYNPDSKWDCWVIGGRWNGEVKGKPKGDGKGGFNFGEEFHDLNENSCTVKEALYNEFSPFALITPDGEWHESGKMGLWGISTDDKEDWTQEAVKIMKDYEDFLIVSLDCHI